MQLEETPLEGTLVVFDGTVPMSANRSKLQMPDNHRNLRSHTWCRRIRWPLFGHAAERRPLKVLEMQ
jgi:hypothetical protein